jgi:hypothetical protein
MAEQSAKRQKPFESWFPEEARQHVHAARQEMRQGVEALFPPGFAEHRRKARKEMLLAWRSMIDSALEHIEEREKQPKKA